MWIDTILCICPSLDELLGYSHFLPVMNSVCSGYSCTFFRVDVFFNSLGIYLGVEQRGYMVTLCLIFWGTSTLFSTVVHHFTFSPKMCKASTFSTSLPTLCFFVVVVLFRAAPKAYGGSQARGPIGATAAGLCHSHSSARSKPGMQPTPQITAMLDTWSDERGQGSNPHPHGSWLDLFLLHNDGNSTNTCYCQSFWLWAIFLAVRWYLIVVLISFP